MYYKKSNKLIIADLIGQENGECGGQVQRYIRFIIP